MACSGGLKYVLLEATIFHEAAIGDTPPLLPSLHTCPLQSSYSSSQALPPASSDALPSSSIITFNLEEQDPPTEDEESMRDGEGEHEPVRDEDRSRKYDSPKSMKQKARKKTRRRRTGQSTSTISTDVTSGSSTMDTAFTSEKSIDHLYSTDCPHSSDFGCHTSAFTIDPECALFSSFTT